MKAYPKDFEEQVIAILSLKHKIETKPANKYGSRPLLHIDGVPCGDMSMPCPRALSVYRWRQGTTFRERRLSTDPTKAATALVERLETYRRTEAKGKLLDEADDRREDLQERLREAFDVPGSRVEVRGDVEFSFSLATCSEEQAAKLAAAILGVLSGSNTESPPRTGVDQDKG